MTENEIEKSEVRDHANNLLNQAGYHVDGLPDRGPVGILGVTNVVWD